MELELSRLRRGEVVAAFSALLLLVFMFFLKWYGPGGAAGAFGSRRGVSGSVNAWHALSVLRWLMLLTIIVAFALAYLQATQRSPALPVSAGVLVTTLAGLLVILLIYRVLINEPGPDGLFDQKAGAFLGLLSAAGIAFGGYESMREEGLPAKDARTQVETVSVSSGGSEPGTTLRQPPAS